MIILRNRLVLEVLARVKAQLRRASLAEQDTGNEHKIYKYGALEVDTAAYEVRRHGKPINLTLREFELVAFLVPMLVRYSQGKDC